MNKLPIARNKDIVVQTLDKEVLIYDLNTHKAYNLNETSSIVYQACDGKTSFDGRKSVLKVTFTAKPLIKPYLKSRAFSILSHKPPHN